MMSVFSRLFNLRLADSAGQVPDCDGAYSEPTASTLICQLPMQLDYAPRPSPSGEAPAML